MDNPWYSKRHVNLIQETLEELQKLGYDETSILAVINTDTKKRMAWMEFKDINYDFTYDCSYGLNEVNLCLQILLKDNSWLERHEYDGSEWWEHKKFPNLDEYTIGRVSL